MSAANQIRCREPTVRSGCRRHARAITRRWLLSVLLLLALPAAAGSDHDRARRLYQSGEILPLTAILEQAAKLQPGRVLEVDLERSRGRWLYELEILDDHGQVWELKLDAASGELIERKRDD